MNHIIFNVSTIYEQSDDIQKLKAFLLELHLSVKYTARYNAAYCSLQCCILQTNDK